ncbi:MAG: PrsW family intramembrane metalloprotease [Spirochaetaceae bacterium]|nr:MAG: PrsW family intramembrane metalloprotease [Spirochaetaceae bacterium]
MNDTSNNNRIRSLSGYTAAFLLGFPLLLLVRLVERSLRTNLLTSSMIEEGAKVCLFLALCLFLRLAGGRIPAVKEPGLLPFVCIIGFAVGENSLYFFSAPTTTIYQRLVYSYPLHLNTGLLYTWIFLSVRLHERTGQRIFPRVLVAVFGACIGTAYHFFLNVLALNATNPTVCLIGTANIVALILLFLMLHRKRIERSLIHAGL